MSNVIEVLEALIARLKGLDSNPNPTQAQEVKSWLILHFDSLKPLLLEKLEVKIPKRVDTDLVTVTIELDDSKLIEQVYAGNTVGQLKEIVEKRKAIPRTDQDIRQRGITVDDNTKVSALMPSGLGYEVRVYHNQIGHHNQIPFITITGRRDQLDIDASTNGEQLKALIYRRYNIVPARQRIVAGIHTILDTDNIIDVWTKGGRQPLRLLYV